ncbi:MAG TPA: ATP synthase F0 subunit B [Acidimicrobiales bacterium]|nr:ATP synthase F0 subunit B [Acidimicrobiales bacterium]
MSNPAGQGAAVPETEVLLQRVAGMIAGARALPLSSSVKLDNKDEILELLREANERLPEELRQARWMIKEREEFLAGTQRRADELVEAGRSEAQRLVQRTEILKEAQAQARRTLEEARQEAQRLRLEAEDYADQKLAQFEIVLERTLKTVASGRHKLSGLPEKDDDAGGSAGGGIDTLPGRARPLSASGDVTRRTGGPGSPSAGRSGGLGLGASHSTGPAGGPHSGEVPVADENLFDQDRLG